MALPPRNTNSTIAQHLADHNKLHERFNTLGEDGPIPAAKLGSGTPDANKVLRGDGAWVTPTAGSIPVDVGIRYVHSGGNDANDGLSWATAKLHPSAAGLSLAGDGLVLIGPSKGATIIKDSGIPLYQGIRYQGLSPSKTQLMLADGANQSLFVTPSALAGTEFAHWCGVSSMYLRGNRVNNTAGHGIEFNSRIGENTRLVDLTIVDFPGDGIRGNRGGQPVFWNDLHFFFNAVSGISLRRTGSDLYQSVYLSGIAGDNNPGGLIHIKGLTNRTKEAVTLVGIKPEHGSGQPDCIILEDVQCVVSVIGGSTISPGTGSGNTWVKITGTQNPHLTLQGLATGYNNWIDDAVNGTTLPRIGSSDPLNYLLYQRGQVLFRMDGTFTFLPAFGQGLMLADGITTPATLAGWASLYVDTADGDLKVKFGDGTVKTIAVDT